MCLTFKAFSNIQEFLSEWLTWLPTAAKSATQKKMGESPAVGDEKF